MTAWRIAPKHGRTWGRPRARSTRSAHGAAISAGLQATRGSTCIPPATAAVGNRVGPSQISTATPTRSPASGGWTAAQSHRPCADRATHLAGIRVGHASPCCQAVWHVKAAAATAHDLGARRLAMRILLAVDGSEPSTHRHRGRGGSLSLPAGSVIEVMTVIADQPLTYGLMAGRRDDPVADALDRTFAEVRAQVDETAAGLATDGTNDLHHRSPRSPGIRDRHRGLPVRRRPAGRRSSRPQRGRTALPWLRVVRAGRPGALSGPRGADAPHRCGSSSPPMGPIDGSAAAPFSGHRRSLASPP